MPYYHSRIIIREINHGCGFPAENLEEAKIRLQEQLVDVINKNIVVCTVKVSHNKA